MAPGTRSSGTWGIRDDAAATSGGTGEGPFLAVVPGGGRGDGLTEVTMTVVEDGAGLVFRYLDPENYWSIVANQGVGTWTVNRTIDGDAEVAGEFPGPTNDDVTISVEQKGSGLRFMADGVEFGSIPADGALADQLQGGLIAAGTTQGEARWNRFLVMTYGESSGGGDDHHDRPRVGRRPPASGRGRAPGSPGPGPGPRSPRCSSPAPPWGRACSSTSTWSPRPTPRCPTASGASGPELPRGVPYQVPLTWLSTLLDGALVAKAAMVLVLVLAFAGAHRLAAGAPAVARVAAGLVYAAGPFLATRLAIGHLGTALAAALLPWALPTLLRPGDSLRRTLLWSAALGACGVNGGLLAGAAIARRAWSRTGAAGHPGCSEWA